ncbi:MAG: TetR/AcrR family transcriptional regulator [Conexibacter sp.]
MGATRSNGTAQDADGATTPRARILTPVTQRERLLDAMARTVSLRGYTSTSVADVLKVARISRRTFYEQFIDKEDCFLAAYDAIAAVCTDRFVAAYRAAPSWDAGLAAGYEVLLRTLAAEPDFARLGVVEVLAAGPRALARRDETLRRFMHFVDDARERAAPAAVPPALVAQAIAGGIYELVYSRIVRGETTTLPELLDELLHYTFMLLGVSPRPA